MEFTVCDTVNFKKRRHAKFTQILDEVDKTEGQVALASVMFHRVVAPTFDVNLASQERSPYLGQ